MSQHVPIYENTQKQSKIKYITGGSLRCVVDCRRKHNMKYDAGGREDLIAGKRGGRRASGALSNEKEDPLHASSPYPPPPHGTGANRCVYCSKCTEPNRASSNAQHLSNTHTLSLSRAYVSRDSSSRLVALAAQSASGPWAAGKSKRAHCTHMDSTVIDSWDSESTCTALYIK